VVDPHDETVARLDLERVPVTVVTASGEAIEGTVTDDRGAATIRVWFECVVGAAGLDALSSLTPAVSSAVVVSTTI
jgi:hypothetical protein